MGGRTIHGAGSNGEETPEYRSWTHMRERCNNPKHHAYSEYGGAGITVDPRWNCFVTFLQDIGPRPTKKHTLDRIKNSEGYKPGNCRWATRKEQANNRGNNRSVEYMGVRYSTIMELSVFLGVRYHTLANRINNNWPNHLWGVKSKSFGTKRPKG